MRGRCDTKNMRRKKVVRKSKQATNGQKLDARRIDEHIRGKLTDFAVVEDSEEGRAQGDDP